MTCIPIKNNDFKHYISSSFKSFEKKKKWFAFGDIFFAFRHHCEAPDMVEKITSKEQRNLDNEVDTKIRSSLKGKENYPLKEIEQPSLKQAG